MRTFGIVVLALISLLLLYIAVQQYKGNDLIFCVIKIPKKIVLKEVKKEEIKREEVSKIIPAFSLNSFTGKR